jgi:hypothetical protein
MDVKTRPRRVWFFVSMLAVLLGALSPSAYAQSFDTIGIRAQGLGGAFVALADDATATWWNPAGIAVGPYLSSIVEYDRTQDPSAQRARAITLTVPSLGLSYYRLQLNQIRPTISTVGTGSSRQDLGVLSQFGVTVGQSLGDAVVVASTLKLEHALDNTQADLDVGIIVKSTHVRAGATLRNVRAPGFGSGANTLVLERQARAGVAVTSGSSTGGEVALAADVDLTTTPTVAGDERHLAGGIELWAPNRRIGVRGGVAMNTIGETRASASGGLSVAFRKGAYIDTELTGGSDLARKGWGIDLRLTF